MKKCCQMLAKYFGVMAVVFLVLGLVTPTSWLWILGKVQGVSVLSVLLGVIMFGMGTTLDLKDFLVIFRRPRDIFLGALAQYTIMPFLAFALGTLFALEPGLTAGLVLLGACPGGTTSNVITYMSKGDLAYSVTMTSVSTLLSPVLTPALTFFLIGKEIAFDPVGVPLHPADRHPPRMPRPCAEILPPESSRCRDRLHPRGLLCHHLPHHRRRRRCLPQSHHG